MYTQLLNVNTRNENFHKKFKFLDYNATYPNCSKKKKSRIRIQVRISIWKKEKNCNPLARQKKPMSLWVLKERISPADPAKFIVPSWYVDLVWLRNSPYRVTRKSRWFFIQVFNYRVLLPNLCLPRVIGLFPARTEKSTSAMERTKKSVDSPAPAWKLSKNLHERLFLFRTRWMRKPTPIQNQKEI